MTDPPNPSQQYAAKSVAAQRDPSLTSKHYLDTLQISLRLLADYSDLYL